MIWLAILAAYALFLLFVWAACVLAGRSDAAQAATDEHSEWLGIGGGLSSIHNHGDIDA